MSRRSIKINNQITSLSMEPAFWNELDRQALVNGQEWQDYARDILLPAGTSNRSAELKVGVLTQLQQDNNQRVAPISCWHIVLKDQSYNFTAQSPLLFVGRSRDCDITLPDREVSRHHAAFIYIAHRWWVIDLNSKNGMKMNNRITEKGMLRKGSSIQLGNTRISPLG